MNLFDRETKREKVLEGIQREKMLRLRTDRGMKSAMKKMTVLGANTFKKVAQRETEEEIQIKDGLEKAEKKFFRSIEDDILMRKKMNKPVIYSDDYDHEQ